MINSASCGISGRRKKEMHVLGSYAVVFPMFVNYLSVL